MSSPVGKEYLFDISSHKYDENVNELLTADTVDLMENTGFVWPTGKDHFLRRFNVSSQEDIQAMAEVALAILALVFAHGKKGSVMIKTHLPA